MTSAPSVVSLDTYSGHADKNELKRYVENITGNLKKIFCIHGEESQCLAHAETLRADETESRSARAGIPAGGGDLRLTAIDN